MSTGEAGTSAEQLFASARSGSVDAWGELYLLARPQLYAFARLRLATQHQADDAVSETFTRAIAAAERYRSGSGVVAWLVGICRNVVRESYRAGGRSTSIDPARFAADAGASRDPEPGDQVMVDEQAAALRRAFGLLSDQDRELLSLRVVVGLGAEEVAEVVGKRAGAVRMAQSRALARLRAHLEEGT
ncbi:sigma-70 family RNA polymerase sigma factor [soil metagenome]